MTRFGVFIGMLLLVVVAGSGCCLRNRMCVNRCGGGDGCCAPGVDPILGDCNQCGVCGGKCPGYTPCGFLKSRLTCGMGCSGQVYYGEWISDPPDCCDPCDNCGNWTGSVCCAKKRPIASGLKAMWGTPYRGCCGPIAGGIWGGRYSSCNACGDAGCSAGGCTGGNCASGGCSGPGCSHNAPHRAMPENAQEEMMDNAHAAPPRAAMPTPAQTPRRAAPQPKAELPTNLNRASYGRVPASTQSTAYQSRNGAYPPSRLR